MFAKTLMSLTISIATVTSVELTAKEDTIAILTPDELKMLIEDGMTEELVTSLSSLNTVYMDLTYPT